MQAKSVANSSTMNKFQTLYTEAMEIRKVFALNLERLRELKGLTAKALGEKVGVTSKHIYDLEKARKGPSIELLHALAKELGVSTKDLLAEEGVIPFKSEPVSKTLVKIIAIPDEVYDRAPLFPKDHDVWKTILNAMDDAREREGSSKATRSQS